MQNKCIHNLKREKIKPISLCLGGESGSADTARDPRGFAVKFYTEEGNWDLVGNNTPIFFIRDPIFVSRKNESLCRNHILVLGCILTIILYPQYPVEY